MLTRMFAYFTVVAYLVVGTVVVRVLQTDTQNLEFSQSYLKLLSETKIESETELAAVNTPVMKFEFKKNSSKVAMTNNNQKRKRVVQRIHQEIAHQMKWEKIKSFEKNELPFASPITLKPIIKETFLAANLVASFEAFSYSEKKIQVAEKSEEIIDEVKVTQAVSQEVEPEFFEYEAKSEKVENPAVAQNTETKNETQDILDLMTPPQAVTTRPVEVKKSEPIQFVNVAQTVTTQEPVVSNPIPQAPKIPSQRKPQTVSENSFVNSQALQAPTTFSTSVTIHAVGMNLKGSEKLQGFELRFQDQNGGTLEDFGAGSVTFDGNLAASKMTRSVVMLKKGFVPTSTELILEEGSSELAIPLIEEDVLYNLNETFEQRGSVGSLLVELDDETEIAKLDVPFGKVVKLNGDFKPTENEDFRYELFLGVKSGNAMITYQKGSGEIVNRIVHIHENELTYDANFYEDVMNEKVKLFEEDLLAKETSPLILAEDQISAFAKETSIKKINQNTYHLNFDVQNLGGRRYLELKHQKESVFVGLRDNNRLTIPSESFMRYILSNFEDSKLGQRCLVQVNLSKKISSYEVQAESSSSTLQAFHQVLDRDGKFYESVSDKTRKIIILGESHATGDTSRDAKINIKIDYQDGSQQFLNSYCSPNTYLVEQL